MAFSLIVQYSTVQYKPFIGYLFVPRETHPICDILTLPYKPPYKLPYKPPYKQHYVWIYPKTSYPKPYKQLVSTVIVPNEITLRCKFGFWFFLRCLGTMSLSLLSGQQSAVSESDRLMRVCSSSVLQYLPNFPDRDHRRLSFFSSFFPPSIWRSDDQNSHG